VLRLCFAILKRIAQYNHHCGKKDGETELVCEMKHKTLLLVVTLLMSPAFGWAAGGGNEAGGLPQLDLTTWPTQLFWLIVTFAIMYLLISVMVTPRIRSVLEDRQQRITNDLEKARDADSKVTEMRLSYEASLEAARSEAAEKARDALNEAKLTAEKAEAEMATKLNRRLKTAEKKMMKMRDDAMANIDEVAAEITAQTVSHLTNLKPEKAAVSKSVKIAMAARANQEAS
jgi:F-type H+-transporting ATPase subunit b